MGIEKGGKSRMILLKALMGSLAIIIIIFFVVEEKVSMFCILLSNFEFVI